VGGGVLVVGWRVVLVLGFGVLGLGVRV
jgi:hypothetical protein